MLIVSLPFWTSCTKVTASARVCFYSGADARGAFVFIESPRTDVNTRLVGRGRGDARALDVIFSARRASCSHSSQERFRNIREGLAGWAFTGEGSKYQFLFQFCYVDRTADVFFLMFTCAFVNYARGCESPSCNVAQWYLHYGEMFCACAVASIICCRTGSAREGEMCAWGKGAG